MHWGACHDLAEVLALLSTAREQLQFLRLHPFSMPETECPSKPAFDPYITRRLNSFAPLRTVEPLSTEETWNSIESLIEGWYEVSVLSRTTKISTWEVCDAKCGCFDFLMKCTRALHTCKSGYAVPKSGSRGFEHVVMWKSLLACLVES